MGLDLSTSSVPRSPQWLVFVEGKLDRLRFGIRPTKRAPDGSIDKGVSKLRQELKQSYSDGFASGHTGLKLYPAIPTPNHHRAVNNNDADIQDILNVVVIPHVFFPLYHGIAASLRE